MNKFLTKIIGASLAIAMMIGVGTFANSVKEAKETYADSSYAYTFTAKQFSANDQTKTLNGVDWTADGSGNFWGYDSTKGQQFGSGSAPARDLTLATSGISGTISSVIVNASTANSATANINCTVGGAAFGTQAQSLTNSNASYTFSGSASGEIIINLKQPSTSKALYIKGISVTYSTGQPEAQLTGISLKTPATKTAYYPGENFDPTGLSITLSYDIADPVDVVYNNETKDDFSWSPTVITDAGNVQITYKDNSGMKVNQAVTLVTPLTVAQAISAIDAADSNTVPNAYVQGIISQIDSYNDTYHSITYWISDDGTTSNQFEVYSGKGLNGANFASIYDIELGATVVVYGTMKLYGQNPAVYEFVQNNCLKSYTEPVKTLVSISLEGNFKTSYLVSESLDTSNVKVIAKYDNGALKDVTSEAVFSDPAMATARRNTVTVSYTEGGVTATTSYRIVTNTQIQGQFNYYNSETIAEGDYLLVYSYNENQNHVAIKNVITDAKRAEAFDVEIGGQNRITTPYSYVVWHIAQAGEYYTFRSKENGKYLASTGTKNQAALVDEVNDNAKWSLTFNNGKYDFANLARSNGTNPGNKWLRYNLDVNNFACYADATGGALELYRQNAYTRLVNSATKSSVSYRYTLNEGNYSFSNVAIRFTGSVGVDTWNDLKAEDEILGYGIMFAETSEVTKYGQGKTIKELYQPIRNYYSSVDECFVTSGGKQYLNGYVNKIKYFYTELADSESHPAQVGSEYGWNLYKNIDDSLEGASLTALTTSYTGVAFIRTRNSELIFLREENVTAGELAFRNLYNGTEFSNDEVRGSMAQMACLDIAA